MQILWEKETLKERKEKSSAGLFETHTQSDIKRRARFRTTKGDKRGRERLRLRKGKGLNVCRDGGFHSWGERGHYGP